MASDETLGEATDRQGRSVVLLGRVWHDKVLRDHPELTDQATAALRAVSAPDHVEHDPAFADRTRYYAREVGPSRWLLVVVSYEQEPGWIVSVFGTRKDPRSWTE